MIAMRLRSVWRTQNAHFEYICGSTRPFFLSSPSRHPSDRSEPTIEWGKVINHCLARAKRACENSTTDCMRSKCVRRTAAARLDKRNKNAVLCVNAFLRSNWKLTEAVVLRLRCAYFSRFPGNRNQNDPDSNRQCISTVNERGDHKSLAVRNYIQPKIGNYT